MRNFVLKFILVKKAITYEQLSCKQVLIDLVPMGDWSPAQVERLV